MQESHKSMDRMESALQEKEANSMCPSSFARALRTEKLRRRGVTCRRSRLVRTGKGAAECACQKKSRTSTLIFDAQGIVGQEGPYAA